MDTLEGVSLSRILDSIPINNKTNKYIANFVADYLIYNPSLIDNFVYENGLYHVFVRKINRTHKSPLVYLVQSFSIEEKAINWILKYGDEEIRRHAKYEEGRFALVIVWRLNKWNSYDGYGSLASVDSPLYTTFVFDEPTYKDLIYIHRKKYEWDIEENIIPYWINYVDPNGNIKIGYDFKDFQNILDYVLETLDDEADVLEDYDEFKESVSKMYENFASNPEAYANKMKKQTFKLYYG